MWAPSVEPTMGVWGLMDQTRADVSARWRNNNKRREIYYCEQHVEHMFL